MSAVHFLSICSGIEAASQAWAPLGWQAVGFSEIDPFACAVLAHHHPRVPNFGSLTDFRQWPVDALAQADVLVGGTPCQAFSVAGLRQSLADERGNLTLTLVHLYDHLTEIRHSAGRPAPVLVWEQVPGVLNTPDNAFGCFLGGLAGEDGPLRPPGGAWHDAGYVRGPKRTIAWRVLDAQYQGLAQRRRRVFLVAGPRDGFCAEQVLFEFTGLRRDTPPRREAGEGTAPTLAARTRGGGGLGTDEDGAADVISGPLTANAEHAGDCSPHVAIAFSARARGDDGRGYDRPEQVFGEVVGTLDTMKPHNVAIALGCDTYNGAITGNVAATLGTQSGDGLSSGPSVLQPISNAPAYAVRRLTPKEYERLQGFPDDYTLIPWRGKPADLCPDGPRYKALGNSMAVPVMHWIGARLCAYLCQ